MMRGGFRMAKSRKGSARVAKMIAADSTVASSAVRTGRALATVFLRGAVQVCPVSDNQDHYAARQ